MTHFIKQMFAWKKAIWDYRGTHINKCFSYKDNMRAERVNHINRHFSDTDNMRAHRVTHINRHFSDTIWELIGSLILTDISVIRTIWDGFTHKNKQNKDGIVHYVFLCVTGRNFQIIMYFNSRSLFCLTKQCRPEYNAALCNISSVSSLFAKLHI